MINPSDPRTLTVLVVEDDFVIRETVVAHLAACACQVVEVSSGEQALQALRMRDGYDGVFTDLRLGGAVDGWDVGEVSRAKHPDIPVIYTSGATILPERPVAGSVFIAKPYDPETVLSALRKLCNGGS